MRILMDAVTPCSPISMEYPRSDESPAPGLMRVAKRMSVTRLPNRTRTVYPYWSLQEYY